MTLNILKFGGDAMSTTSNQIKAANIIKNFQGKTIVVCSAMGRCGFPYSTDNLKMLIEETYISNKEQARLLSCGEIISSIRLSYILNKEGLKTYALSIKELNFNCNNNYLNGLILKQNTKTISSLIDQYNTIICPGFIGLNDSDEIVTLGRNGSDYSAIALAKNLNIDTVYLFKDVEGIYHTPPKIYKQNHLYSHLSYDEMLALNSIEFNIVSKKAVEEAKKSNIKIIIKSFLKSNDNYTLISTNASKDVILGFNIINREVQIATFFPCLVKEILEKEFHKSHIFVENEKIEDQKYVFTISKSVNNIVKSIINEQINLLKGENQ